MKRFRSASRVALVGAATAALLFGGVGPAFAVNDESALPTTEATSEGEDSSTKAEAPETPETPDGDFVFTKLSGGTDPVAQNGAQAWATGGLPPTWPQERRKISGIVTVPQGASVSWLKSVQVGADCAYRVKDGIDGGGCGYDISLDTKTGAYTMMVPVIVPGLTVTPGAFVPDVDANESINLVSQSWGQACGVGSAKSTPAGKGHITGVNLPMCLGATLSGKVTVPKSLKGVGGRFSLSAYVGGGITQRKAWVITESTGLNSGPEFVYSFRKLPRANNVVVMLNRNAVLSEQVWNDTYDIGQATPIDTRSGSVTGIDFTAKRGFSDMCMAASACNKFYKEVMWMYDTGISTGIKTDHGVNSTYAYDPKRDVTREAMAAFLYRLDDKSGYEPPTQQLFADIDFNQQFYHQIQWMGATGVSTGTKRNGKSYYEHRKPVTREAMAAFLYRMDDKSGYKAPTKQMFVDVKPSHKFYDQIQWMGKAGISTGTTRNGKQYYDPSTPVTREAMAAFLYRFSG